MTQATRNLRILAGCLKVDRSPFRAGLAAAAGATAAGAAGDVLADEAAGY